MRDGERERETGDAESQREGERRKETKRETEKGRNEVRKKETEKEKERWRRSKIFNFLVRSYLLFRN